MMARILSRTSSATLPRLCKTRSTVPFEVCALSAISLILTIFFFTLDYYSGIFYFHSANLTSNYEDGLNSVFLVKGNYDEQNFSNFFYNKFEILDAAHQFYLTKNHYCSNHCARAQFVFFNACSNTFLNFARKNQFGK